MVRFDVFLVWCRLWTMEDEFGLSLYHVISSWQSKDCLQNLLTDEIECLGQMHEYLRKRAKLQEEFADNLAKLHKATVVRVCFSAPGSPGLHDCIWYFPEAVCSCL